MGSARYRSVPEMFLARVAATPEREAFAGPGPHGSPAWLTWRQVGGRARAIAAGLYSLGVRAEDRVAVLAGTRVEWILADYGIMCAGAATTTVYPTTEPDDAVYILRDAGSKVLVAENADQATKIQGADLPELTAVVVIDGAPPADPRTTLTLPDLEP